MDGTPGAEDAEGVARALPEVPGADRAAIGTAYLDAVVRVLHRTPTIGALAAVFLTPLVASEVGSVSAMVLRNLTDGKAPLWSSIAVACVFGCVVLGFGLFVARSVRRWAPSGLLLAPEFRKGRDASVRMLTYIAVAGAVIPVGCLAVLRAEFTEVYVQLSAGFLNLGTYLVAAVAMTRKRPASATAVPRPRPLDRWGTRLVVLAAAVAEFSRHTEPVADRDVRSVLDDLEILARDAERFALAGAPRWDRAARSAAVTDGWRLAVTVRAHKSSLVTAVSADDFAAVARSLTGGADAWAQADLDTLLREVPPDATRPRKLARVIGRVAPSLTLVALAFTVPLLPPLRHNPQAVDGFRTALLITATFSLFAGGVPVPDLVKTAIDKTVLPK